MNKAKQNKSYKNSVVTVVYENNIETYKILDIIGNDIETEVGMYPLANCMKYFDTGTGGTHYLVNVDLPAKLEAENLKLLRRSQVLNNLFNYDVGKPFDIFKLLPWVVTIVALIF